MLCTGSLNPKCSHIYCFIVTGCTWDGHRGHTKSNLWLQSCQCGYLFVSGLVYSRVGSKKGRRTNIGHGHVFQWPAVVSLHFGTVMPNFDFFLFGVRLHKRLNKQSSSRWFEKFWRSCVVIAMCGYKLAHVVYHCWFNDMVFVSIAAVAVSAPTILLLSRPSGLIAVISSSSRAISPTQRRQTMVRHEQRIVLNAHAFNFVLRFIEYFSCNFISVGFRLHDSFTHIIYNSLNVIGATLLFHRSQ